MVDDIAKSLESMKMNVPADKVWDTFLEGVYGFSDDIFAEGRDQGIQEERELL